MQLQATEETALTNSLHWHPLVRIPDAERADLHAELTIESMREVHTWSGIITEILNAKSNGSTKGATITRLMGEHQLTKKQITYRWELWSRGDPKRGIPKRSWRALVNWRTNQKARDDAKLPHAFVKFLKEKFLSHERDDSGKQVWRWITARALAWHTTRADEHAIPGYYLSDHQPTPGAKELRFATNDIPIGWSYANLMRHQPGEHEKELRRGGPKRASKFRLPVLKTRVGCPYLGFVSFDDQIEDSKVNYFGINSEPTRPMGFFASDFLTSYTDGIHRCGYVRADGTKEGLTEEEFFWWFIRWLTTYGYNQQHGTIIVVEHGTAGFKGEEKFDAIQAALSAVTGGKVTIVRSGLFKDPAVKGLLYGPSVAGNFRMKPIEGVFRIFRTVASGQPNALSLNERMRPVEEMHGKDHENRQWLKLIDQLPPARAAQLLNHNAPHPDFGLWERIARHNLHLVNSRRDHKRRGWHDCGFVRRKYRLAQEVDQWLSDSQMADILRKADPVRRAGLEALIDTPGYSEQHVFNASEARSWCEQTFAGEIAKLSIWDVPVIAPKRLWRSARVGTERPIIEHSDIKISPDSLRYNAARVEDRSGRRQELVRDEKIFILVHPFDQRCIWVAENKGGEPGRFLGIAHQVEESLPMDDTSLGAQMGEAAGIHAAEMVEINDHSTREIQRRLERRDNRTAAEQEASQKKKKGSAAVTKLGARKKKHSPKPEPKKRLFK